MSIKFLELFSETIGFKGTSFETIDSQDLASAGPSYSISFWMSLSTIQKNKQVTVIHKGNNLFSNPLISIQEKTVCIKIDIDRNRTEYLFSSLEVPLKKWTHIAFTLKDYEILEASLFINGAKDSEISVSRTNTGDKLNPAQKIYIGKDPWNHGFMGSISEPVYFFSCIDADLVSKIYQSGISNWNTEKNFATTRLFYTKNERPVSALPENVKPPKLLQSSPRKKKEITINSLNITEKLDNFFEKNPSTYTKVAQISNYFDWLLFIYRILRVSYPLYRDEEGNIENKIEIDRMIPPLHQIQLYFTKSEILELSKILKCHSVVVYGKIPAWKEVEEDDLINFLEFLEGLKKYADSLELGDIALTVDNLESIEKNTSLAFKADDWYGSRNGNFEVCIDFCANCKRHQTSTWHDANQYLQWYNILFKDLNDEFPGISIFGNKYGPPRIGTFGVYLEYTGTENFLDSFGRLKIYKRKNIKPNTREIIDSIYLMAYILSDTNELCARQIEYKKSHPEREKHPDCLTSLASISLEVKKNTSKVVKEFESDTEMFCINWGCLKKNFLYGKNHKKACNYHPGRWEFGSIHGLWPENWTCCRGQWENQGCTYGFHNGIPNQRVPKKCINRGELNPKLGRPDSVCGATFPDPATCGKKYQPPNDCRYHLGHAEVINKTSSVWTCCNMEFNPNFGDDSFCTEAEHRFSEWPDEEAKMYFITKSLTSKKNLSFSQSAKSSRFFNNDIKPYVNPYTAKKERIAIDNENRYCLNWACETVYKEIENTDKACKCHTGYWDFGHSGILKDRETIVLWEPHWRCCGGKWEDPGCQLVRHNGPLVAKMEERKWKWPSEGAKRNFLKKISYLWQKKLESEHLTRKEISQKYDQFCNEVSSKLLPSNMLHRFCLILHLHILCVSEDLSFMFKYQDVISRQAEALLSDRSGFIDKETFLEWWFAPLERIRPEMALT